MTYPISNSPQGPRCLVLWLFREAAARLDMRPHFHPVCFPLSGHVFLCTEHAPSAAGTGTSLHRPELPLQQPGPEPKEWAPAPCRGPETWFLYFPRSGPPGELDASYSEQNKAQEETDPGSRRLYLPFQLQQLRGRDVKTGRVLAATSTAGCQGLRGPLRVTSSTPLPPGVSTSVVCSEVGYGAQEAWTLQDQKSC